MHRYGGLPAWMAVAAVLARRLGHAGLAPFIVLALMLWLLREHGGEAGQHHLDRDALVGVDVDALEHLAHAAGADLQGHLAAR